MPRKFIKRYMPDYTTIKQQKCLHYLGPLLNDPALWHLNRHSVAGAFFVGLLVAFVPVPFQMLLAASMAIVVRVNIPVSVVLVWLTNPLTMAPLFYFAYKIGQWILSLPNRDFRFEISWHWLIHGLNHIWQPFLLGCLVVGLTSGILGYLIVRFAWRAYVIHKWRHRHLHT